jgi:hypothetical protein
MVPSWAISDATWVNALESGIRSPHSLIFETNIQTQAQQFIDVYSQFVERDAACNVEERHIIACISQGFCTKIGTLKFKGFSGAKIRCGISIKSQHP